MPTLAALRRRWGTRLTVLNAYEVSKKAGPFGAQGRLFDYGFASLGMTHLFRGRMKVLN